MSSLEKQMLKYIMFYVCRYCLKYQSGILFGFFLLWTFEPFSINIYVITLFTAFYTNMLIHLLWDQYRTWVSTEYWVVYLVHRHGKGFRKLEEQTSERIVFPFLNEEDGISVLVSLYCSKPSVFGNVFDPSACFFPGCGKCYCFCKSL